MLKGELGPHTRISKLRRLDVGTGTTFAGFKQGDENTEKVASGFLVTAGKVQL